MTATAGIATAIVVFAEDRLGMTLARDLCDRVVCERGPTWLGDLWANDDLRAAQRGWTGLEADDAPTKWKDLPKRLRLHGLGMRGYTLVAYRAVLLAATQASEVGAIVLCHDTDGDETRRKQIQEGVRAARAKAKIERLPILLALAHQECEAWVVAGFSPENAHETDTLSELQKKHGFDPVLEPHRLTARRATNPHDVKKVCKELLGASAAPGVERAERCWLDTPLEELERRGAKTGLPEYLSEVMQSLLPALGG